MEFASPVALAFLLLGAGMAGSVLPLVPSGVLSLAGVGAYRFGTGEPGLLFVGILVAVCVGATLVDWFGGAIAASAGGVSARTAAVAAVAGLVLIPLGPVGILLGMGGTVFAVEYREHGDEKRSVRGALYATAGVLGSAAVQLLLTGAVFGVVVATHLV